MTLLPLFLHIACIPSEGKPHTEGAASAPADTGDDGGWDTYLVFDTGGEEGGGSGSGDGGDDGKYCATFEGTANFKYGYSTSGELSCDLYWATSGSLIDGCEGCIWAFAVDFLYDEGRSYGGADCFGGGETNWTWDLGYVPEYYGSYGALYYNYYGDWTPAFLAYFDGVSVAWGGGYYQYPYDYDGTLYYSTRQWYGYAYIY